jgi:chaperonin GroES
VCPGAGTAPRNIAGSADGRPARKPAEIEIMALKINPLDDRIVVTPLDAEERTAGGVILPDSAKEKPQQGKVVAAGPGKLLKDGARAALSVKKGDTVVYGKYSGTDVKVEGKEYKILRESEILAKFA